MKVSVRLRGIQFSSSVYTRWELGKVLTKISLYSYSDKQQVTCLLLCRCWSLWELCLGLTEFLCFPSVIKIDFCTIWWNSSCAVAHLSLETRRWRNGKSSHDCHKEKLKVALEWQPETPFLTSGSDDKTPFWVHFWQPSCLLVWV